MADEYGADGDRPSGKYVDLKFRMGCTANGECQALVGLTCTGAIGGRMTTRGKAPSHATRSFAQSFPSKRRHLAQASHRHRGAGGDLAMPSEFQGLVLLHS